MTSCTANSAFRAKSFVLYVGSLHRLYTQVKYTTCSIDFLNMHEIQITRISQMVHASCLLLIAFLNDYQNVSTFICIFKRDIGLDPMQGSRHPPFFLPYKQPFLTLGKFIPEVMEQQQYWPMNCTKEGRGRNCSLFPLLLAELHWSMRHERQFCLLPFSVQFSNLHGYYFTSIMWLQEQTALELKMVAGEWENREDIKP